MTGKRTHGMTGTPPYKVWNTMLSRRSEVSVCKKWETFKGFWRDMSATYRPGLCLRRKDLKRGHTPENCYWGHRNQTHGMTGTAPYKVWGGMISRCYNSEDFRYESCGARGITVCNKWRSFEGFWADMGSTYARGLWLSRIDQTKGYDKENCEWATPSVVHLRKTSRTKIQTPWGELTRRDAAERAGIKLGTLHARLAKSWDIEFALRPVEGRHRSERRYLDTQWGRITLSEAARRSGVARSTIQSRLLLGWSVKEALNVTPQKQVRSR